MSSASPRPGHARPAAAAAPLLRQLGRARPSSSSSVCFCSFGPCRGPRRSSVIGNTPLSPNRAFTMSPALPCGLATAALTSVRNASAIFVTSAGGFDVAGLLRQVSPPVAHRGRDVPSAQVLAQPVERRPVELLLLRDLGRGRPPASPIAALRASRRPARTSAARRPSADASFDLLGLEEVLDRLGGVGHLLDRGRDALDFGLRGRAARRPSLRAREDAGERVVVLRRDRVELVVVAAGAGDRQAEEAARQRVDAVVQLVGRRPWRRRRSCSTGPRGRRSPRAADARNSSGASPGSGRRRSAA